MSKGRKYDYRVVQNDADWSVEIVRRVTSKKTTVSKSQGGFATESAAQEWGQKELEAFSQNLNARNKRRSEQRNSGVDKE
ncbi:MAG: DUF3622 domain-containing protein [Gammaproteobacteria bacterium]|nr:DUF3622 domain-containing protein [Gammaproteobacteria bacterium]